jgi:hypothetical protein
MPPRPTLPGANRVILSLKSTDEIGGHVAANIFYIDSAATGPTAADLDTLAASIHGSWVTRLAPLTCTHWHLVNVEITALNGSETQGNDPTDQPGTGQTDPLPPQVAACVSWSIAAAYRGGHPRNYMPGISTGYLTAEGSNELSTAAAVNLATAWNNFNSDVNGFTLDSDPITMGTVSYVRNKAPRVTPVFYGYRSDAARVNTRLASQRRRSGKLAVGFYEG